MDEMIELENIKIEDMIYEIRGVEVMLDADLAKLYQVATKRINEAVKNNPSKFPLRYSFILDDNEKEDLWSNHSTANISSMSRVNPRVFTEQGVYMLATILKSSVATNVSIRIMDTFVKMRHYMSYNRDYLPYKFMLLEDKVNDNTRRIDQLFDRFNPKDIAKNSIFFQGEFYLAYSFLLDVFKTAKDEIIIIDNYAGKELLDILKDLNIKILIVSKNINNNLVKKYSKQYTNVVFIYNNSFHDRFIIIDRSKLYSCGASLKDLGKKCFSINENDIQAYLDEILNIIIKK